MSCPLRDARAGFLTSYRGDRSEFGSGEAIRRNSTHNLQDISALDHRKMIEFVNVLFGEA